MQYDSLRLLLIQTESLVSRGSKHIAAVLKLGVHVSSTCMCRTRMYVSVPVDLAYFIS